MRLLGFERAELQPGESRPLSITVDRRLLARFDESPGQWWIRDGEYTVALARSAGNLVRRATARLTEARFGT